VLGLLKPYYLNIKKVSEGNPNQFTTSREKYSEENHDRFLDENNIRGYAGFFKGLTEAKIVPGVQAKGAVHFSWGNDDEYLKALEMGLMVDVFFKKMPIMITEDNTPLFVNLFVNLQLGKRK
jgi:hypothetical protein